MRARTIIIATAVGLGLITSANAMDGDPGYGWTGFYIGGNLGGAWGEVSTQTVIADPGDYFVSSDGKDIAETGRQKLQPDGITGGATVGYNFIFGSFLLGAEGDLNFLGGDDSKRSGREYTSAPGTSFAIRSSFDPDWLATIRGRLGTTFGNWLVYGTGGWAFAEVNTKLVFTDNYDSALATSSRSGVATGWTVGGGTEVGLSERWSLKAEYLHIELDDLPSAKNVRVMTGSGDSGLLRQNWDDVNFDVVRVGVNYRFGGGHKAVVEGSPLLK